MDKLWIVGAFLGGVAVGLWVAKQYAKQTISSDISNTLNSVGLGGGTIEKVAQAVIVPQV